MQIKTDPKAPLGIKDQIKRQIRLRIQSGELEAGQALPSARDLAAFLNVNRNTVSHAYKELATEGFLNVVVGSGSYVKEGLVLHDMDALKDHLKEAVGQAVRKGFTVEQVKDAFFSLLLGVSDEIPSGKILVVDCNRETLDFLSDALTKKLDVEIEAVLIQELEADPEAALKRTEGKDLIVCGFNHVEEFKRAVPSNEKDIVGVLFKPDIKVLNAVLRLPPGSRVGYCCANQRSTETLFNSAFFAKGTEVKRILVGLDRKTSLIEELLKDCDMIFASSFVFDRVRGLAGPKKQVIRVDLTVDDANIDLVRERLLALGK